MHLSRRLTKFLFIAFISLAPLSSFAGVFVSIGIAPPPLPVYEQPACPDDGYLWTPGYWAYGPFGYYWVPGVWIQPPGFGLLWTPGYWGWGGGGYFFHTGYWGPHVGFYGGVNYGFGYGGFGFGGGHWAGGHFFYNSAVANVNVTNIHNTYVDRTVVNNGASGRNVSFNGGAGGVQAKPTEQDRQFAQEHHVPATASQQAHVRAASQDRNQLASVNGGRPATLAAPRPDAYSSIAKQNATSRPLTDQDKVQTKPQESSSENKISEERHTESTPAEPKHESHEASTEAPAKKQHHKSPAASHADSSQHPQHEQHQGQDRPKPKPEPQKQKKDH